MPALTKKDLIENAAAFERAGVQVPAFAIDRVREKTAAAPVWVHFGAGNLYKAFHAALQQTLLERGLADRGIIAVAPNDFESVKTLYAPHDGLFIRVVMKADGSLVKQVVASTAEVLPANPEDAAAWGRLREIFAHPSLQMVTLAITEKGYDLRGLDGKLQAGLVRELDQGLAAPRHTMAKLCALVYERYQAGALPLALVSTDNFSHNGDKLREAVLTVAREWLARGAVSPGYIDYLTGGQRLSFPLSMIDKITPLPSEKVAQALAASGIEGMELIRTERGGVNAPFVNTEEAEYLVIEDNFPNGRPALEHAGVYFTDAATVDKVERMKVCTCLNPLHTALAVFGCLLGYDSIAAEMGDPELLALVQGIAYREGLPVVTDPGIINPEGFVRDVLTIRLPNANIPDTPQRIAADTSQKLAIRFGETIKRYMLQGEIEKLALIPLALAGWCRYLLGLDDTGRPFTPSSDPLLGVMRGELAGVELGNPQTGEGALKNILSNEKIFGLDLYAAGLGGKVEAYFTELIAGPGAVRKTLQKYTKTAR
ncbi:MAG: mannitol dehydrogenase family protein [Treponema sp.]|jgi:fructuronate reductase|nr:mannitol dehydrogenase family protein [Treponema sp.]